MKKILALVLALIMVLGLVACAAKEEAPAADAPAADAPAAEEKTSYKIGFSLYNVVNPVWAEIAESMIAHGTELGHEVTYVDCGKDAQKQISQIENFMTSGYDAIIILPIDPVSVEEVVVEAKEAGIRVLSYSSDFVGAEMNLALDPVLSGETLVKMAKPYLDEKYPDGKFDWVFMDLPSIPLGVLEGDAVREAMAREFPNATLLTCMEVLDIEQGLSVTENLMQTYPDCRVFMGISGGVGVGGTEAIKQNVPEAEWEDYLLFAVDATEQELNYIEEGTILDGSMGFGAGRIHGILMVDYAIDLIEGREVARYIGLPCYNVDTPEEARQYRETGELDAGPDGVSG